MEKPVLSKIQSPLGEAIWIDGSFGEGGGQVLRSSSALALLLDQTIHVTKIRAGRDKPGVIFIFILRSKRLHDLSFCDESRWNLNLSFRLEAPAFDWAPVCLSSLWRETSG